MAKLDVDAAREGARTALVGLTDIHFDVLSAFAKAEPSFADQLVELRSLARRLYDGYQERYHAVLPGMQLRTTRAFEDWVHKADEVIDVLATARVPLFNGSRLRQRQEHTAQVVELLGQAVALRVHLRRIAFDQLRNRGPHQAVERMRELEATATGLVGALPPVPVGAAAFSDARWKKWQPREAMDRLCFEVGSVAVPRLHFWTYPPGGAGVPIEADVIETDMPTVDVPVFLDLDRTGGLVSDSADTINAVVLHCLAALPGGRVKCSVFDPENLGESMRFIFALGDSAEAVIGAKVRTTQRELADQLLALEEHITFVTQKYLQGQYDSLTEYNTNAGEVAEPYRLLVLYDYPQGFSRSPSYADDEVLTRLGKIVTAGPRCGVFTLVVDPHGFVDPDTDSEFAAPLLGLPCLRGGIPVRPESLARLYAENGAAEQDEYAYAGALVVNNFDGSRLVDESFDGRCVYTSGMSRLWEFTSATMPTPAVATRILAEIDRSVVQADDVRVAPEQVISLYEARVRKEAARDGVTPTRVATLDDDTSWWGGDSTDELAVPFGRVGASNVGVLRFDSKSFSGVLLGGRPGAGKSVLLHTIILGLALQYSPADLDLYLIDFKEGVEFKQYADLGLPHATVVAVESERDFGLSVLEGIDAEIVRRGELFRRSAGSDADIASFRRGSGIAIPRIVLVIDEFHVLFDRDDRLAARAAELLDRVVRQGRAFGVHTILASQTIAGTAALGRHTLNQIPVRIALQSSDADSRLLLADDNADANLLTRPGEGIVNTKGGVKDGNQRFQASFVEPERRQRILRRLRAVADAAGHRRRPVVFEGNAPALVEATPPSELSELFSAGTTPTLPLGLPLSLAGPVAARLSREPGGNLLVVGNDASQTSATVGLAVASLVAQGVACQVVDFGAGPEFAAAMGEVSALGGVRMGRRKDARSWLVRLAAEVGRRHADSDFSAGPECLVLAALHRARDLETLDLDSSASDAEVLEGILRDGPDVGIHVIASVDQIVSLERRLPPSALREFGQRVAYRMSKEDSYRLTESELAGTMSSAQAVFHDDSRSMTFRFRPFTAPSREWVESLVAEHRPMPVGTDAAR